MVAALVQTANSFLDRMFVGALGSAALAAVGVGGQLIFLMMALAMAVSMGSTAIVARMAGAGDMTNLQRAARQSLGIALGLGLVMTALSYIVLPLMLHWYELAPDTRWAHTPVFVAGDGRFARHVFDDGLDGHFSRVG
jgi:Na+-driven multidrug efflux pump